MVTRWGVSTGGPPDPWISVRDPIDEGDPIEHDEEDIMFVGLFRHHVANMISKIGHTDLARTIRTLTAPKCIVTTLMMITEMNQHVKF